MMAEIFRFLPGLAHAGPPPSQQTSVHQEGAGSSSYHLCSAIWFPVTQSFQYTQTVSSRTERLAYHRQCRSLPKSKFSTVQSGVLKFTCARTIEKDKYIEYVLVSNAHYYQV